MPVDLQSPLTPDDVERVHQAEADAYEALFAVARPLLGTGSRRSGHTLVIWHPSEDEAGYNTVVNFHRAERLDETFAKGLTLVSAAGAVVFGVPVDARLGDWASPERLRQLELEYQSDEVVWACRIDPEQHGKHPTPPAGITIGPCDLDRAGVEAVINRAWGLEESDPRGRLYSLARTVPNWKTYLARAGDEIVGLSVFASYRDVALLMLAVVMPEVRGRGLQSYFIAERLAEAADRGCTLAFSETNDPNASPRNLQRAGFQRVLVRQVFRREIVR